MLPQLKALATDKSPFTGRRAAQGTPACTGSKPELVAEIEFAGFTGDGIVRQAAFKGLREDKPAAEVKAETPAPAAKAELATPDKRKPASSQGGAMASSNGIVMGVTISKPDKALWPDDGRARRHQARARALLEAVGPWMLAHIKGRPCSIIRTPDGIGGEHFFQRHAGKGFSPCVTAREGRGDRKPYLQIDRVEALVAVAQIAARRIPPLELRSRSSPRCRAAWSSISIPRRTCLRRVIEAAKEIKARLEAWASSPSARPPAARACTSSRRWSASNQQDRLAGGQGLRPGSVCRHGRRRARPLPGQHGQDAAHGPHLPRLSAQRPHGDRRRAAVAARPRRRAVSMPLTWAQVRNGLDPKRYTIRTAPALLAKMSAWEDYGDGERPLEPAMRKLVGR